MKLIIKKKTEAPKPVAIAPVEKKKAPPHLDGMCLKVMEISPNMAIPWWLISSYLYYVHDVSLLSDGLYDEMAKAMHEAWDELEHDHKHLITLDDLKAGSLFRLKASDYPGRVKGAALHLVHGEMGLSLKEV